MNSLHPLATGIILKFQRLSFHHTDALLNFESANRQWFESLISARPEQFYSEQGVRDHITDLLMLCERQRFYPFVALINKTIVARVNIKDVDNSLREASIGYRVAKDHTGKGIASQCVSFAIQEANKRNIRILRAEVLENNPASVSVLMKNGFLKEGTKGKSILIKGEAFRCESFTLHLT